MDYFFDIQFCKKRSKKKYSRRISIKDSISCFSNINGYGALRHLGAFYRESSLKPCSAWKFRKAFFHKYPLNGAYGYFHTILAQ